jgi:Fic family protein
MTYTEVQERNGKRYYYRVMSIRKGDKISKKRKYLGVDLDLKKLKQLEKEADEIINVSLNKLLKKNEIKKLSLIKNTYSKLPKSTFENRYETFLAQFTYDSNAIEGNTLTLQETSFILFEQRTPKGKSIREINEVLNHKEAFDYILQHDEDISKKLICEVQKIVVKGTLRKDLESQIGKYRLVQVYVRGSNFIPPSPILAKKEMRNLLRWYSLNKQKLHPLILAAYFHLAFESIHPFVDGNGRTGRLLMNFILHKNGFPMINIPNKIKLDYYSCLDKGRNGDLRTLVKLLYDLLIKGNFLV